MDKITLTGMQFFGRHGVMTEEKVLGQRFVIDMELRLDLQAAGANDNLNATVNYAEVFAVVKGIVEGRPYRLIEALAEAIASQVKAEFTLVQQVCVTVHKPEAPIEGIFSDVSVSIVR